MRRIFIFLNSTLFDFLQTTSPDCDLSIAAVMAAVISPVGQITYKEEDYPVADGRKGELSQKLYDEIVGLQYGERTDTRGWVEKIN